MSVQLGRGTIAVMRLDPTRGHEQRGTRPCVIVTDPEIAEDQRYPMVCIVPITRTRGEGALYPSLAPRGGLRARSYALVDQVRSVDKGRISMVVGRVSAAELSMIDDGLRLLLGLR